MLPPHSLEPSLSGLGCEHAASLTCCEGQAAEETTGQALQETATGEPRFVTIPGYKPGIYLKTILEDSGIPL